MTEFIILVLAFADVFAAAWNAAPAMWTALCAMLVAITFCAWDGLDRRGLRATAWGICAGACFGFAMAVA